MSSRSHIDHAVVKNQKVFPVFARKLSNPEQKNYVDACKRLGTWLGDAKAYYSAARPKIVELIRIAEATLKGAVPQVFPEDGSPAILNRANCPPARHPTFDAYVALIRTVEPFYKLFDGEIELSGHLHTLLLAAGMHVTPPPVAPSSPSSVVPPASSTASITAQHGSPAAPAALASPDAPAAAAPTAPAPTGPVQPIRRSQPPSPSLAHSIAQAHPRALAQDIARRSLSSTPTLSQASSSIAAPSSSALADLYKRTSSQHSPPPQTRAGTLGQSTSTTMSQSSKLPQPTAYTAPTSIPPHPIASTSAPPARPTIDTDASSNRAPSKEDDSDMPDFIRSDLQWYRAQRMKQGLAASPTTPGFGAASASPVVAPARSMPLTPAPAASPSTAPQNPLAVPGVAKVVSLGTPTTPTAVNAPVQAAPQSSLPATAYTAPPSMTVSSSGAPVSRPPAPDPTSVSASLPTSAPGRTPPTSAVIASGALNRPSPPMGRLSPPQMQASPKLASKPASTSAPPPPVFPVAVAAASPVVSSFGQPALSGSRKLSAGGVAPHLASTSASTSALPSSPPRPKLEAKNSTHRDLRAETLSHRRNTSSSGKSLTLLSRTPNGSEDTKRPSSPTGKQPVRDAPAAGQVSEVIDVDAMEVDEGTGPAKPPNKIIDTAVFKAPESAVVMDVDPLPDPPSLTAMAVDSVPQGALSPPTRPVTPPSRRHSALASPFEAEIKNAPSGAQISRSISASTSTSKQTEQISLSGAQQSKEEPEAPAAVVSAATAPLASSAAGAAESAASTSQTRSMIAQNPFDASAGPARSRKRTNAASDASTPQKPSVSRTTSKTPSSPPKASSSSSPTGSTPTKKLRLRLDHAPPSTDSAFAWMGPVSTVPNKFDLQIQDAMEALQSEDPSKELPAVDEVDSSAPDDTLQSGAKGASGDIASVATSTAPPTAPINPAVTTSDRTSQSPQPTPYEHPRAGLSQVLRKRSLSPSVKDGRAVRRRPNDQAPSTPATATPRATSMERMVSTAVSAAPPTMPSRTAPASLTVGASSRPPLASEHKDFPAATNGVPVAVNVAPAVPLTNGHKPSPPPDLPNATKSRTWSLPPVAVKDESDGEEDMELEDELASDVEQESITEIVGLQRGRSGHSTYHVEFVVSSERWAHLQKWTTAVNHDEDVSGARCLSMACYTLPSSAGQIPTYNQIINNTRANWGSVHGGLSVSINGMSPFPVPSLLPVWDGLIDLSQWLHQGTNVVRFHQTFGMTEKIFVVLAHNPLAPQLEMLNKRRESERRWQASLRELCAPLKPSGFAELWAELEKSS